MIVALLNFSCSGAKSPTEAYQILYKAVKAKDTGKIKQMMSKNTLALAESQAQRQNQTIEKVLENGFLATTFSDTMPQIRDERIKDEFGAVEVYNQKESKWEDTFFINEGGGWKLAVGDLFKGSFKMPDKSKAQKEQEMSNSSMNDMVPVAPIADANISPANNNSKVKTVEVTPENKSKK